MSIDLYILIWLEVIANRRRPLKKFSAFRSFAKPPPQVQTVCECIVIMRGYKEISWKTAKGMMADTNFLSSLQNLDVDGITQPQVCLHYSTLLLVHA